MHGDDFQLILHLLGHVRQVVRVLLRDKHPLYARPLGGHQLFREAADGHDDAPQGHLPGHGVPGIHGLSRHQGGQGRGERNARGGAVLGHGAGRHMDVKVILGKLLRCLGEHGFYQADGNLHRLLHHVPQLAGDCHPAASLCKQGLDKQDFPAGLGPGKAGDNAGIFRLKHMVVADGGQLQKLPQLVGGDADLLLLSGHNPHRRRPA